MITKRESTTTRDTFSEVLKTVCFEHYNHRSEFIAIRQNTKISIFISNPLMGFWGFGVGKVSGGLAKVLDVLGMV